MQMILLLLLSLIQIDKISSQTTLSSEKIIINNAQLLSKEELHAITVTADQVVVKTTLNNLASLTLPDGASKSFVYSDITSSGKYRKKRDTQFGIDVTSLELNVNKKYCKLRRKIY